MTPKRYGGAGTREEARDFAPKASGPLMGLLFCRLRTWAIINETARIAEDVGGPGAILVSELTLLAARKIENWRVTS